MAYRTSAFKVVLLGSSNTGKTTLARRMMSGEFAAREESTVGVDVTRSEGFVLFDTAGQERFDSVARMFYRKADCALLFVSKDVERSAQMALEWNKRIRAENDLCALGLVVAKTDLEGAHEKLGADMVVAVQPDRVFFVSSERNTGVSDLKHWLDDLADGHGEARAQGIELRTKNRQCDCLGDCRVS